MELVCPRPKCTEHLKKSSLMHRDRKLWCNVCTFRIKEAPYSCVRCDVDYCQGCYEIKRNAQWRTGGALRTRQFVQASPRQPTPIRRARFEDDEEEDDPLDDGVEADEEEAAPKRQYVRNSPVKGKRCSKLPFRDPSLDPLDNDGHVKTAKQIGNEHSMWTQKVHDHTEYVLETVCFIAARTACTFHCRHHRRKHFRDTCARV